MEEEFKQSLALYLKNKSRIEDLEENRLYQQTQQNIKLLKKHDTALKKQIIAQMVKMDKKQLDIASPYPISLCLEDKKMPKKYDHTTIENGIRRALENAPPESSTHVLECIEEVAKETFVSALEGHKNKGNISKCFDLKINKALDSIVAVDSAGY